MNPQRIAALAILPLALAACGGSLAPKAASTADPVRPAATRSATPAGYHNPLTLARSIRRGEDRELADRSGPYYQAGVHITSVKCIETGPQSATCLMQASDGVIRTTQVTISADGKHWIGK